MSHLVSTLMSFQSILHHQIKAFPLFPTSFLPAITAALHLKLQVNLFLMQSKADQQRGPSLLFCDFFTTRFPPPNKAIHHPKEALPHKGLLDENYRKKKVKKKGKGDKDEDIEDKWKSGDEKYDSNNTIEYELDRLGKKLMSAKNSTLTLSKFKKMAFPL